MYSLKKYIAKCGIFLLLFSAWGCQDSGTIKQERLMQIKLYIQSDQLRVTFLNASSKEINIWAPNSFWGWEAISFRLKTKSSPDIKTVKRKERDWTGEGESSLKILPGGSQNFQLNLKDGWWNLDEAISKFKDESILVQAVFNSLPSEEANENGVFIGELKSDWVVSEPPHKWLFSDHQLQLRLNIESDLLVVNIINITPNEINVWDFNTPWGWEVISFRLKSDNKEYVIKRKPITFQENPSCFKLLPDGGYEISFNLQDGTWHLDELIQNLKEVPIQIQIRLDIPVYPETEKYQAFFGSLQSDWVSSIPPHVWFVSQ